MGNVLKTKATEILGIEYPILNGAMQWIATAPLVAAVSEAGGLGVLSAASFATAEDMRAELKVIKSMTDKPFAVNLTLMPSLAPPDYPSYIKVAAEEGVRIIETSGRAPDKLMPLMKEYGMVTMHKCTTIKHALKAQSCGCDMVILDGCECAGHIGENDITTMTLVPRGADVLDIPVIACGGVQDGRSLAAVLMLGAVGATIGTRFFVSKESPALEKVKEFVAKDVTEMDTTLCLRPYQNTIRAYNGGVAKKINELEKENVPFEEVAQYASGRRLKAAMCETGDLDDGMLSLGLSVGNIHEVLSCKEIIDSMVEGALACMKSYL